MIRRRSKRSASIVTAILAVAALHASLALGYNTIEHAWLGLKSADQLWANIDPAFHESLNHATWPNSHAARNKFMLTKFYLIGCMLPDMFLGYEMAASRYLIDSLYPYRNSLMAPLKIYGHTDSMVATDLHWTDPQPNDNFPALWNMVQYAKSQNWTSYEKALIYGACAHVAMDLMAGCYQQPSLYGSDFVADPPNAESLGDILADMELQSSIFEPTYLSTDSSLTWERLIYFLYGWPTKWGNDDYRIEHGPLQFYKEVDLTQGAVLNTWQDLHFEPVAKFVDAVSATGYGCNNLTQDRVEAYMLGWSMSLFMLCGFPCDTGSGAFLVDSSGGVFSHPDWTFSDFSSFFYSIGDANIYIDKWYIRALPSYIQHILKQNRIRPFFDSLSFFVPDLMGLQDSWTSYLESPDNLGLWWDAVPESLHPLLQSTHDRLLSYIGYWNQWASGSRHPNLRATYAGEPTFATRLFPELRKTVEGGPTYLSQRMKVAFNQDSAETRLTARKAGLVGGMFGYGGVTLRQPGILNMCFKQGNQLLYDTLYAVPTSGDSNIAWLYYDMMPFNSLVWLRVLGTTTSGRIQLAERFMENDTFKRVIDSVPFDLTAAAQQGVTKLSFRVCCIPNSGPIELMLDADYDSTYNSHVCFDSNQLYIHWLKGGEPTRATSENPVSNPKMYWPYATAMTQGVGYFVASPTSAGAVSTHEGINLTWQNRSTHADRVVILRSEDNGGFERYDSVGPSICEYLDADVESGHSYDYRVVALHDTFASELSNTASASFALLWEHRSDVPWNAKHRRVRYGGSLAGLESSNDYYVYALKGSNTYEFYRYGVTGNRSWTTKESIPAVGASGTAKRAFKGAALTTGSDGKLYALKGNNTPDFWRYDPSLSGGDTYPWSRLDTIPPGPSHRRVKEGAALAAVTVNDTCCVYFLKGSNTCEFFRYNTLSGVWATMASAPVGSRNRRFKDGSCLTYDPDNGSIYALKGGTVEFYSYSVAQNTWASRESTRAGQSGKKKVARFGTSLAYESGRVYALKGYHTNDLSFYDPNGHTWAIACSLQLYPSAKGVGYGGALTVAAGHLWALRGNNTLDFWRYSPGQEQGLAAGSEESKPGKTEALVASASGAANPRWSPNGNFIVYTAPDANGHNQVFAAYVNDTLSPVQITNIQGQCAFPSFAPDANHIVFQYQLDTAGYSRIGVAALQGGSTVTAGRSAADCRNPEFSSSGLQVYFESDDGNGFSQLWSVSALGGTPTQLTSSLMNHVSPKALSSTALIFQGEDGDGLGQIYRLTIGPGTELQLTSSSVDRESPCVSQSSSIVAYVVTDQDGYQQIAKVSANGGSETWLTTGQADHTAPSITGDGLTIECTQSNVSSNSICEISTVTGSTTQRTDNCAGRESPDSRVTNSTKRWVSAAYARADGIYRTVNGGGGGTGNVGAIVSFDAFGPNPSAGRSTLFWSLRAPTSVQIRLFDVTGRSVRTFLDGTTPAGNYQTQLDTRKLAHGVYVLRVKAGDYRKTYKLILE